MKKFNLTSAMCALVGVLCLASSVLTLPMHTASAAPARTLAGSETKDWASLADGVGASEDVTVYGAKLGDFCVASMSVSTASTSVTCNVTATNTATVRVQNESTATVDMASGTLRVQVIPYTNTGG